MERPTCGTCPYFSEDEAGETVDGKYGLCRRHAPHPIFVNKVVEEEDDTIWPILLSDEWCGEHPDFPEWLESQQKADIKRPCRECGRETWLKPRDGRNGRCQRMCDYGHNNGWEDMPVQTGPTV